MSEKKEKVKNKKKLFIIIAIIAVVAVVLFLVFGLTYIRRHFKTVNVDIEELVKADKIDMGDGKGIIIYFTRVGNTNFDPDVDAVSSASLMSYKGELVGNSQLLAGMIKSATGYPDYAITIKNKYSSSYNATIKEAVDEMRADRASEFDKELPDLSEYDKIILVYPLWWYTLPMPVETFLNETDMEGKTIYSLVTHGGGGFANAVKDTSKYTKATVSDITLSVYDDDVTEALPQVTEWLKKIAADK